ncbi:hypothetical protein [Arthrobacter sp. UYCo732]|uniref:hypothetical protein n=1 Tax=Arthrobacter sp. UYCo732 TaxID=3156336 RepID=UPI003391FC98
MNIKVSGHAPEPTARHRLVHHRYATLAQWTRHERDQEVRAPEDWTSLCREFPLEVTASRRHDWFRATGRHGRWVIPGWERVADRWDAAPLTVRCYLSAAGRALGVDPDTATVVAGWDPGSTLWLADAGREWDGPRQAWHLTQDRSWRRLRLSVRPPDTL